MDDKKHWGRSRRNRRHRRNQQKDRNENKSESKVLMRRSEAAEHNNNKSHQKKDEYPPLQTESNHSRVWANKVIDNKKRLVAPSTIWSREKFNSTIVSDTQIETIFDKGLEGARILKSCPFFNDSPSVPNYT